MNIEIMRKHYERTPKETLINVLVASREQVDKLQKRNKELKQEIERLNNIIDELEKWIKENDLGKYRTENVIDTDELLNKLQELKGSDKE